MVDCKDSLRTLTKDSVCTARRIRDTWGRAQSPSLGGGRLGFFHSVKCGDIQGQHRSCGLGEGQSQMDQECTYSSFIQSLSKVPLDRGCGGCWWYLPDPRYPASAHPPNPCCQCLMPTAAPPCGLFSDERGVPWGVSTPPIPQPMTA